MPLRRWSTLAALALLVSLVAVAAPATAAVPSNDNRAAAASMVWGNTYGVTTTDATSEAGEPQPCGVSSGHSVWYSFTPGVDASYSFDTSGASFDTVVSLENAGGLILGCSDDIAPGTNTASRLVIALTAGQTYYVRVAGFAADSGNFSMFVYSDPPANDDRVDAAPLPLTANQKVTLLRSDTESDEPSADCDGGVTATVWYSYDATQAGRLVLDNNNWYGSRLRLYDATSGTPDLIVCDNYRDGDSGQYSRINQYVKPGHHYLLQVGVPNGTTSQVALLSAAFTAATQPAQDSFATPLTLIGRSGSTVVDAGLMTTEQFEYPLYAGAGTHSAWFRWTAPVDGTLSMTINSFYQPTLRVWADVPYPYLLSAAGIGIPSSGAGTVTRTVPVTGGRTYRVMADHRGTPSFTLDRSFIPSGGADLGVSSAKVAGTRVRLDFLVSPVVADPTVQLKIDVTGLSGLSVTRSAGVSTCTLHGSHADCAAAMAAGDPITVSVSGTPTAENVSGKVTLIGDSGTGQATRSFGPSQVCDRYGTARADRITGTAGDDILCGLGGNDTVFPGLGNDLVLGGTGIDMVSYPGTRAVKVDLRTQSATGAGRDRLVSFESATGSSKADTLTGTAGINVLIGGAGIDRLFGLGGNDNLVGGAGRDVLVGGPGRDICVGAPDVRQGCEY